MKQQLLLAVALSFAMLAPASAKGPAESRDVEIRFAEPYPKEAPAAPGDRAPSLFGKVIVVSRSGVQHELLVRNGDDPFEGGGPDDFHLSPHGQYVVLRTLSVGWVDHDGQQERHERPGCVFVDTDTGEILDRGNWGECAGIFTLENVWRNFEGNEVVLQRRR